VPEPALDDLGPIAERRAVSGGDINAALYVRLADGRELFVKHGADARAGFYAAEAAGLEWLRAGPLPVPVVVAVADDYLALEWVQRGSRAAGFDEELGRGLAQLHRLGAERFGCDGPTFIGSLEVPNVPTPPRLAGAHGAAEPTVSSWPAFYGACRLAPLLRAAERALPGGCAARVERVMERLDDLCGPDEPPARLHGDLWSGNVMAGPDGAPWLIDPAAYGGHREIDLAMLELFGAPSPAFYAAYDEVWPRATGHEDRVALYQLLPLLVHAALFGGGYGASVDRAAAHYA
jgi:fructosamine-3-kinase